MRASFFKDPLNPTNEELSLYLAITIPKEQQDRVYEGMGGYELNSEFMGFVKTYWHLSRLIPKDYHIFDFGAGYNAQSYFFTEHESYSAIEPELNIEKEFIMFQPPNCTIYNTDARTFLKTFKDIPEKSFAIVNFVPSWFEQNALELVKRRFQNCYTFYPISLK